MKRRTTGIVVALGLLLSGCGTLVVIPSGAEQVIKRVVLSHTGITISHISCPSGIHAKAGNSFDCHFTAQGQRYTAHMVITKVKGTAVYYQVTAERG
jgi:Domain of unknown function (DUF4333)